MSLEVQWLTFAAMILSGISMGVLFDAYRVVAAQIPVRRYIYSALDILYWLVVTPAVFLTLYRTNQGELRIYVFIGLILGVWCYYTFFSSWTVKTVQVMYRWTVKLIKFCIALFTMMVIRPVIFIYKGIIILLSFLAVLSIFTGKIMVQLVYPLWKLALMLFFPWRKLSRWLNRLWTWFKNRFKSL